MSHPSKVDLLTKAHKQGFRTYLYFVATESPEINVSRVAIRVKQGGHNVPEDKIRSRYQRSLNLLKSAVAETDRAYLFDNSGEDKEFCWIAEVTNGNRLEWKTGSIPNWCSKALIE